MTGTAQVAAVLWTGGKDSALALYRAREGGAAIELLATFVPEGPVGFEAHPLERMRAQARALGLAHETIAVREPYREAYVEGLRRLKAAHGLTAVVTGDIDLVGGQPNWIVECCRGLDLDVLRPLWQQPREALLRDLVARGIEAQVTYIADRALPEAWLGRTIDRDFVDDVVELSRRTGIDPCGENGEYHTMVDAFPGGMRVADAH